MEVGEVSEATATATVDVSFEDNTGIPRFLITWKLLKEGGEWKLDNQASAKKLTSPEPTPDDAQNSSEGGTAANAEAESVETPEPITLSGSGQQATDPFQLESGLTILRLDYQGGGNFIVDLLDENGRPVGFMGIANEIGSFEGSTAVRTKAGQHLLDVQASGEWTIIIEQPRPTSAPETTRFGGDGMTATPLFRLSSGLKRFTMTHQGRGNFIVDLLNEEGRPVGYQGLVNDIGRFSGSKAIRVPRDGIYLLQVEASGPWTVEIE